MGIKQFLKEKKELIKTNRRLIALGCGISAVMVAVPSITGVVTSHQAKNKKDKDKYYYTPGEIRFDENGKLIIPEIIDKDKPSNGYQYKLEPSQRIDLNNELFKQEKFKKDLKANLTKTFDTIQKSDKYKMDFEFKVTDDIKLLLKNLITDKDLELGETIHINDFMNTIIGECINNPNYDVLTQYNPEQLCALSGISLEKEYNDMMVQINNYQNPSFYGGVGALPNRPNNPTFDEPNKVDLNNITIKEYDQQVLAQNEYYQYIFMITYTVVLPAFIALNVILNMLNLFSFGAFLILIAQTALDIIFATMQIKFAIINWENTKTLRKNINELLELASYNEICASSINYGALASSFFSLSSSIFEFNKILNNKIKKNFIFNEVFSKKIHLTISAAKISLSILSIAFSITMRILESNLIKNYE